MPLKPDPTKKPIPETVQGWAFELLGLHNFFRREAFYREKMGPTWIRKMMNYNKQRFDYLLDNPPEGARFTKTKILKG
jgi:hypothetical protein